jgi:hypothetical protein
MYIKTCCMHMEVLSDVILQTIHEQDRRNKAYIYEVIYIYEVTEACVYIYI